MFKRLTLGLACLAVSVDVTAAPDNLTTLGQMKVATTDLNIPVVPQEGKNADALRKNLESITLPPGFKIDLYAVAPDVRHMAVAPSTNMLFAGTRKTTVWAITDRNNDKVADEVKSFAPSLKFSNPNAVCWTPDGFLVVAEHNRILNFPAAEFFYEGPDVAVSVVVPQGELIPVEEESFNHGARVCEIGPDGKLYVTLGQPFNVQPMDKIDLYNKVGIGGIVRMNLDGSEREVYAMGARNPVGLNFSPDGKSLWWTDHQVDGLGNDIPPGELNKSTKSGQHFGFPYWNGKFKVAGSSAAPDHKNMKKPKGAIFPQAYFPAHQAQNGMIFGTKTNFPDKYKNGVFVASHGSWNRTEASGAEVQFVPIKNGKAGKMEVFASGWLNKKTGTYQGRPVDVAILKDGSLLVSDDYAGAIYRISYSNEEVASIK